MTRTVKCQKLGEELPGLEHAPYPGELGQKIYHNISSNAWQMWVQHQTMLINEYQLNLMEKQSRDFLTKEMEKFLFAGGSDKPAGYVSPDSDNASNE